MSGSRAEDSAVSNEPRGGMWGMLASIGPGIVVTGSVIGSGELINTPVQAATFGFILLWAVLLSCVVKYFLQVEIARHCLVENRTTFEAINECPGPKFRGTSWIGLFYMGGYLITTLPIIGIIGALGGLMHDLWPLPTSPENSVYLWGTFNVLLTLGLLWGGAYGHLETLVTVLVAGFSISVGIGLLLIQGTEYPISGGDVASGLTLSLGPEPRAGAFAVLSLMGALGVAANELFMYPYWILEKGYATKLGDPRDAGWTGRARYWINTIRLDAGLATIIATVVTAAFYLLGAAVLFRQHVMPKGLGVVEQISSVYTATYGEWSRWVFYVGAFCTLFSTLTVYVAASGRMWADLFCSLGWVDRKNDQSVRRWHQILQIVWLVGLWAAFMVMPKEPATWILHGHYVLGAFMMPLLMFAIVWMAFHTDARVRMGRAWGTAFVASAVVIAVCVLVSLTIQFWPVG
jgi:Mn2+/Fe2+ NRAMP family transporter